MTIEMLPRAVPKSYHYFSGQPETPARHSAMSHRSRNQSREHSRANHSSRAVSSARPKLDASTAGFFKKLELFRFFLVLFVGLLLG